MIDLFGMVLAGATSWGVGTILDVTLECFHCSHPTVTTVGNTQKNAIGCTNCGNEAVQFTNACDYTVAPTGRIAHAAAIFRGDWTVDVDPLGGKMYTGWAFFHTAMRAQHLANRQLVLAGELVDYNAGTVYHQWDGIYTSNHPDCCWYGDDHRLPLRWDAIPSEERDSRVYAVDLYIRSRFRDDLFRERFLVQFWE